MSCHGSHCCKKHGCKYSDPACTVVMGIEPQQYRQECCDDSDRYLYEHYVAILKDMEEKQISSITIGDIRKFLSDGKKRYEQRAW